MCRSLATQQPPPTSTYYERSTYKFRASSRGGEDLFACYVYFIYSKVPSTISHSLADSYLSKLNLTATMVTMIRLFTNKLYGMGYIRPRFLCSGIECETCECQGREISMDKRNGTGRRLMNRKSFQRVEDFKWYRSFRFLGSFGALMSKYVP